ncbi:GNAT family N-acetyltransferase [Belnapia rosea]|uniref:Ribosomal protein S18 acetylase RimI n=1 Tax=Belnapia rosea TaxID=938405 RepID=A0A1G6K1S8_9PROT|nr:GNAT family N-acetyltransferase [Belnapia rosea]SDC24934.1 Ribosomal protein S18 acetylase RimI [Belnapia rosea]
MSPAEIRPGRDEDRAGFIRLIGDCWAEFPNCILDVDREAPELRALASYFAKAGGQLWAAEKAGRVVGMVGTRPLNSDQAFEICRMYVEATERGTGLAQRLLEAAETHARAAGAQRLVLWTDTRFDAAHRFYEKRGYLRQGAIRILDDISKSLEFRYAKPAAGLVVEALDAAAAASAERRLSEILIACVESGASVNFIRPLAPEMAHGFWKKVAADVAANRRILLAAWLEGELVGTVQLNLDTPQNQPHRADLAKLLVDPSARRRGVARALMQRAEQTAQRLRRRLLVLDTLAGDNAEPLYRSLGWQEAGRIPDYALDETGAAHATIIFWKAV